MHPLGHKYYYTLDGGNPNVVLDLNDKQCIRDVVDWCYHVRGLGCIALTDHDMIQASLYCAEYVKEIGYPMEVITGAECSVCNPHLEIGHDGVHLLCLGITSLPPYNPRTSVSKMIEAVHDVGGYVIMSHPIEYPESFKRYAHLLDGYEYQNGNHFDFEDGAKILKSQGLEIKAFNNSDYHYGGVQFGKMDHLNLPYNIYIDDPLLD